MDWTQILQKIYDPTRHALRVKLGDADSASMGRDFPQLWKDCYDETGNYLRVILLGAPSGTPNGNRDGAQAMIESVDLTKSKLRLVS